MRKIKIILLIASLVGESLPSEAMDADYSKEMGEEKYVKIRVWQRPPTSSYLPDISSYITSTTPFVTKNPGHASLEIVEKKSEEEEVLQQTYFSICSDSIFTSYDEEKKLRGEPEDCFKLYSLNHKSILEYFSNIKNYEENNSSFLVLKLLKAGEIEKRLLSTVNKAITGVNFVDSSIIPSIKNIGSGIATSIKDLVYYEGRPAGSALAGWAANLFIGGLTGYVIMGVAVADGLYNSFHIVPALYHDVPSEYLSEYNVDAHRINSLLTKARKLEREKYPQTAKWDPLLQYSINVPKNRTRSDTSESMTDSMDLIQIKKSIGDARTQAKKWRAVSSVYEQKGNINLARYAAELANIKHQEVSNIKLIRKMYRGQLDKRV